MGRRRDDLRQSEECAWGVFLDTLILRLRDVGEDESLALVAPPGDLGLSRQLVIRYLDDPGWTWVTRGVAGSTGAEVMVGRCVEDDYVPLAVEMVRVAREEFGLPHPQLFTASALGPGAGRLAEALGLEDVDLARERGARISETEQVSGGPDALLPMIVDVAGEVFGTAPRVDDDGDVVLDIAGTTAFVLVSPDGLLVQAWAMVARGIYSRRTAAVEVGLANRDSARATWFVQDRDLFLRLTLPARPLVRTHVADMLRAFADELVSTRSDLAYRLGARAA
jgi:hypothetical protein